MLKVRGGTLIKRLLEVFASRRLAWDETTESLYCGNGYTPGGIRIGGKGDTTDYTLYIATTALGGTSSGVGRQLESGVTTVTATNKLVNGNASFTSALLNKTVYNTTDGTWAKINNFDSTTQLNLSENIMAVSENYVICDAVDSLSAAYALLDSPYKANIMIRFSPGTFAGDATLIGKIAGENKAVTVQGDNLAGGGGTILSGDITIYDNITLAGGVNYNLKFSGAVVIKGGAIVTGNYCDFLKRLETRGNANCSWSNTLATSPAKLYKYDNAINSFNTCTVIFGNDPGTYTAINSTITKGYTMHVASATLGGSDATGDGLSMYSGSATSTTANKLVDSGASFGTDVVNKTLYNSTDDTWAKVTARDSATQLSISADIMASGEAYIISNAFATVQKAVDAIPGTVNCNTTLKLSNEIYREDVDIWGKNFSGAYSIYIKGTRSILSSGTATSGANPAGNGSAGYGTLTDTGKAWTINAYQNKFVEITAGTGSGQIRVVHSNTATVITITGRWDTVPDATSAYRVLQIDTRVTGANSGAETTPVRDYAFKLDNGQKGINLWHLKIDYAGNANFEGGVMIFGGSLCNIAYCHIEGNNYHGVMLDGASSGSLKFNVFKSQIFFDVYVIAGSSLSSMRGNRMTVSSIHGVVASTQGTIFDLYETYIGQDVGSGIVADNGGIIIIDAYLEVNGCTGTNILSSNLSSVFINALYGAWSTIVSMNSGAWGMKAESGSVGVNVASITYSGNTSGTYTPTTMIAGGNS